MKTTCIAATIVAAFLLPGRAEKLVFDFKDPKGANNLTFKLDAPLESISGSGNGISGTIVTDPANFESFSGTLVVQVGSLQVPNPLMNFHLHGDAWLDAKKYPEITFVVKGVAKVKKDGVNAAGEVTGTLTLHGVSREITAPASVTYLPGRLKDRIPGTEGDLLVIRSDFSVKRSDYGIQPGRSEDKVSEEIKISLAVAGAAPRKP